MDSKQRLMATLRGEAVDRPAVNFYEIGGLVMDPNDTDAFNVYNDPSWKPLLKMAEEYTDLVRMRSPVRAESCLAWGDSGNDKGIRNEFFKVEIFEKDGCRITRTELSIGGRKMTSTTQRTQDVDTIWTTEHLLKSSEDLIAYLQLPDQVFAETIEIKPLLEEEERIGNRGIVMVDTEDPVCAAATLFSMEDYLILAMTEKELFHQLLEKLSRYIWLRTEKVAAQFPGRLWRIYGPEYVTEPYFSPGYFEEYVVRYSGPMVKIIQKHGGFARIHCHGRIRNVLDHIAAMGADAIDPVEPMPQGDVQLKDVCAKYGEQLVIFGNIEVSDIENLPNEEFAAVVDRMLDDFFGYCGRGFVVMPSSSPFGRKISPKTLQNYETLLKKTRVL